MPVSSSGDDRVPTVRIPYPNTRIAAVAWCLAVSAGLAPAQTRGDNGSHDPSRFIEDGGKLYAYSTGGGMKSSPDGLAWTAGATPPWNRNLLAGNQGIWAPDIVKADGVFRLYGSMWNESQKSSVLVLLASPTLDPSSPAYKWTDQGEVVACPQGVTRSCIDPAPFLDKDGKAWVVWGGGYPFANEASSIWLTPLDRATGLPLATDPGYRPPANPGYPLENGHKEGPYIHYRNGYYYLWWQTGSCCSGASSSYTMHVARAGVVTGPYTGDRVFYASQEDKGINGPGHLGILSCRGQDYFSYHYYPASGFSVLGLNALSWDANGWPVAGAQVAKGLQLPCGDGTAVIGKSAAAPRPLRIRAGQAGREILSGSPGRLEIRNTAGELLRSVPLATGWNRIAEGDLGTGLNALRAVTSEGTAVALLPKQGK